MFSRWKKKQFPIQFPRKQKWKFMFRDDKTLRSSGNYRLKENLYAEEGWLDRHNAFLQRWFVSIFLADNIKLTKCVAFQTQQISLLNLVFSSFSIVKFSACWNIRDPSKFVTETHTFNSIQYGWSRFFFYFDNSGCMIAKNKYKLFKLKITKVI